MDPPPLLGAFDTLPNKQKNCDRKVLNQKCFGQILFDLNLLNQIKKKLNSMGFDLV